MKTVITILMALLAILPFSHAFSQNNKPGKEETIKFIDNTLKKCIGQTYERENQTVLDILFDGTILKQTIKFPQSDNTILETKYIILNWENVNSVTLYQGISENDKINLMGVKFTNKVEKIKKWKYWKQPKTEYQEYIDFYIPAEKKESLEKAFWRLKEIAEEENKDPFAE